MGTLLEVHQKGMTGKVTRKQAILLERLGTYCKQLGVEHPKVFWTKKAFKERYPGQRVGKRWLGLCWRIKGAILVVYNKHNGLRDLDYTLRHELVHWRFPQVEHGARFDRLIKQIKDGICWEPFTNADFDAYEKKRMDSYHKRMEIWNQKHGNS